MADDPMSALPRVPAVDASLPGELELGALSISLAVADLDASRAFYEALGFVVTGGAAEADYLILKNGESTIGLFHQMIDRTTLTFNPGLTPRMERLGSFTDVRDIAEALERAGVTVEQAIEPGSEGPGSITVIDPDGNPILIDQFF